MPCTFQRLAAWEASIDTAFLVIYLATFCVKTVFRGLWGGGIVPVKWTLASAFAYFGASGANSRWSWSARSPDNNLVVLTLWRDDFDYSTHPVSYSSFGNKTELWSGRPGNRERLENLIWVRDHCDGLFRVAITVAKDTNAQPREIATCAPQPRMVMRLLELDEQIGEFRAELADDVAWQKPAPSAPT